MIKSVFNHSHASVSKGFSEGVNDVLQLYISNTTLSIVSCTRRTGRGWLRSCSGLVRWRWSRLGPSGGPASSHRSGLFGLPATVLSLGALGRRTTGPVSTGTN
jgi:hypothetical protein